MNRYIAIGLAATLWGGAAHAQSPTPARRVVQSTAAQPTSTRAGQPRQAVAAAKPKQRVAATSARGTDGRAVGTGVRAAKSAVMPAAAMQAGEVIYEGYEGPVAGPVIMGETAYDPGVYEQAIYDPGIPVASGSSCDSCGSGSCGGGCSSGTCGPRPFSFGGLDICNPPAASRQLCICLPAHGWVQTDYLMWYQDAMEIPALLTTSSTATDEGILGRATTSSLLPSELLTERFNGGRIRFGWWFANNPDLGLELEYLSVGENEYAFDSRSTGSPLLARPFFNVVTGEQDSELIARTGVVGGSAAVDAYSELQGGAIRFRKSLCCGTTCKVSHLNCQPVESQGRVDATIGWRTLELNEGLRIATDVQSQVTADPGSTLAEDNFRTRNQFNGVELGFMVQTRRGYWTLDGLLRTSFGNVREVVTIEGSSEITDVVNGTTTTTEYGYGLLTQPSNSGSYRREGFAVVPEFGATLGYQLTDRTRLTAGYTFLYWSKVARPGSQIDTDLNPNFIPPATGPAAGAQRPQFRFAESDYFIQGLNLGAEYRW